MAGKYYCIHPAERTWTPGDSPVLDPADTCDHSGCAPPTIEWVRRLDVKADETLVVAIRATSMEVMARATEVIKSGLPEGVRVLVTHAPMDLTVVANADLASDDEPMRG